MNNFGIVEENVSLKKYNTYKIDAKARYVVHPSDVSHLIALLEYLKKENISYFVLGNGSNVIFDDGIFNGVVIKLDLFDDITYDEEVVTVGAGVMINALSLAIIDHGLKGLEWASGIPGTIGGCIYGNAGAYKMDTFTYLESVKYLTSDLEVVERKNISSSYRSSFFKENKDNIIISATFRFPKGEKDESLRIIKERFQRRKESQPLEYPTCGSVFKNPGGDISSGKLIDDLGLKGFTIGGAKVSEKHANFIINKGNATGKDIRELITMIKDIVFDEYGINLEVEAEIKDWCRDEKKKN